MRSARGALAVGGALALLATTTACTSADTAAPVVTLAHTTSPSVAPPVGSSPATPVPTPTFSRLTSPAYGPVGEDPTLARYVSAILRDANHVWTLLLEQRGLRWKVPKSHPVGARQLVQSACRGGLAGDPAEDPSAIPAFYCPDDNGVYLSLPWLRTEVWLLHVGEPADEEHRPPVRRGGDLAVAAVVTHEVGHAVQQALGVKHGVSAMPTELQADCFAGVWANYRFRTGDLHGSVGAALDSLHDAGDTFVEDPGHHGTSTERLSAFAEGLKDGDVDRCPLGVGATSTPDPGGEVPGVVPSLGPSAVPTSEETP